jgi:hypothetical protein
MSFRKKFTALVLCAGVGVAATSIAVQTPASAAVGCWGNTLTRELTGGVTNNRYARHKFYYIGCSNGNGVLSTEYISNHDIFPLNIIGQLFVDTAKTGEYHGGTGAACGSGTGNGKATIRVGFGKLSVGSSWPDSITATVCADSTGWASASGSYWVW